MGLLGSASLFLFSHSGPRPFKELCRCDSCCWWTSSLRKKTSCFWCGRWHFTQLLILVTVSLAIQPEFSATPFLAFMTGSSSNSSRVQAPLRAAGGTQALEKGRLLHCAPTVLSQYIFATAYAAN